jgi:hypothetical protein
VWNLRVARLHAGRLRKGTPWGRSSKFGLRSQLHSVKLRFASGLEPKAHLSFTSFSFELSPSDFAQLVARKGRLRFAQSSGGFENPPTYIRSPESARRDALKVKLLFTRESRSLTCDNAAEFPKF